MRHPNYLINYDSTEELANELSDLRYDVLQKFLFELATKLMIDAQKDEDKNRLQLANHLKNASTNLLLASIDIQCAWGICYKHMEEKDVN